MKRRSREVKTPVEWKGPQGVIGFVAGHGVSDERTALTTSDWKLLERLGPVILA